MHKLTKRQLLMLHSMITDEAALAGFDMEYAESPVIEAKHRLRLEDLNGILAKLEAAIAGRPRAKQSRRESPYGI